MRSPRRCAACSRRRTPSLGPRQVPRGLPRGGGRAPRGDEPGPARPRAGPGARGGARPRLPHGALDQGHGGVARLRGDRRALASARGPHAGGAQRGPRRWRGAGAALQGPRGARSDGRRGARARRGPAGGPGARRRPRRAAGAGRRRRPAQKKSPAPALSAPGGRAGPVEPLAPPPTVRVRTETLDRFLSTVGEVILNASQVRAVGELQRRALALRTTPLLRILEPLPRLARDVAQRLGKRVEVEITGGEL